MKLLAARTTAALGFALAPVLCAQIAAPASVDLPEPSPAKRATPPALPLTAPELPELSKLDEAFNRTSIGKTGDEFRQRVEIRRLQNRVGNDEDIVTAKHWAEAATTDLQKRERLREYYDLYYGRMRRLASGEETRKALDDLKASHVKLLEQPRVRPIPGQPLPKVSKKDKTDKPKKSRFGRTSGQNARD
jgi:hypothetical protein